MTSSSPRRAPQYWGFHKYTEQIREGPRFSTEQTCVEFQTTHTEGSQQFHSFIVWGVLVHQRISHWPPPPPPIPPPPLTTTLSQTRITRSDRNRVIGDGRSRGHHIELPNPSELISSRQPQEEPAVGRQLERRWHDSSWATRGYGD